MDKTIECPECGKKVGKASTFCMNCGARLAAPNDQTPEDIMKRELAEAKQEAREKGFTRIDIASEEKANDVGTSTLEESALEPLPEHEEELPPDDLLWDSDKAEPKDGMPIEEDDVKIPLEKDQDFGTLSDSKTKIESDMSWEIPEMEADDVKEGMPFKEIKPPEVKSTKPIRSTEREQAVQHLFPEGKYETSEDFVERVVGKPTEIKAPDKMQELDTPSCPNCGVALSDDDFDYPSYVYEAMAQARMEFGEQKVDENEHEFAIEQFEKSKKLAERASNEKMVKESIKKIDEAYEKMAEFHFDQAESHKKAGQYEWAIVQYKKAREIYMLTTDKKMRAKAAEKARDCYVDWGEYLEDKADELAKHGRTREALATYQEAAEKYKEGGNNKKLRGLDKKIRKA